MVITKCNGALEDLAQVGEAFGHGAVDHEDEDAEMVVEQVDPLDADGGEHAEPDKVAAERGDDGQHDRQHHGSDRHRVQDHAQQVISR